MQHLNTFKLPKNFRGKNAFVVQLWWLVESTFFRMSPQFMYGFRRSLLRLFGAKIGKKVIISMGGATASISLDNFTERDTFVSSMNSIINTYGFDGIDIDFEGSSISVSGGTISAPTDAKIINLIYAIKQIMSDYYSANGKHLILTMAPETAFVQGGMSAYGGIWGAYLPVIHALRDSLDLLHVQLYNSGSMYGIDRNIYTQGNADFIVAMTEAVIQGFSTSGGVFNGLPASKVAVGLPACTSAAGGGFVDTTTVKSAIAYLLGTGSKPGSYTLAQAGGHPTLRGMMTWSINWDAVSTCNGTYSFSKNYKKIFGDSTLTSIANYDINQTNFVISPNPTENIITMESSELSQSPELVVIINSIGEIQFSQEISLGSNQINTINLKPGIYFIRYRNTLKKFIKI